MWLRKRLADAFILKPTRHPIEQPRLSLRRCFDGPFGRVECFGFRKPPGGEPEAAEHDAPPADLLILKLPGTGGRAERSSAFPAQMFSGRDVETWVWNPPGYGGSEGKATLSAMPPTVLSLWDQVVSERCGDETETLVMGNSLGCATALYLASERSPDALLLRNPPPLVELVQAGNAWWNGFHGGTWIAKAIVDEMNAMLTGTKCRAKALFIRSGRDSLVLPSMQAQIFDKYGGPKTLFELKDADHATPLLDEDLPILKQHLLAMMGSRK